jgi:hypothetical protein
MPGMIGRKWAQRLCETKMVHINNEYRMQERNEHSRRQSKCKEQKKKYIGELGRMVCIFVMKSAG